MKKSVNTEVISTFATSLFGLLQRKIRRPKDPVMSSAKCVSLRLLNPKSLHII